MIRVNTLPGALDKLARTDETAQQLRDVAEKVADRINPPSEMETFVRSGVSRRGAFAQAGIRGEGAVPAEYGSINNAPGGYVRSATRRVR